MKISIGADHGGYRLKEIVRRFIEELGHQVTDRGTDSEKSVNYPDFAKAVTEDVLCGKADRGILICGTGIGMSMAANRKKGIRAALCQECFSARMSREHNNANVLCLGERVIGTGLATEIVRIWLDTEFAGGRHLQRIEMF
ncbi:MAG: ribose 5-phosphate isomerase B [Deltaproteobacteria bacterium]